MLGRLAFLALISALALNAQSITGALSGSVTDPSEAAIVGAKIRLLNPATGIERSATSNEAGRFFFGSIQPASYSLFIEAQGFRRLERNFVEQCVCCGDLERH